MRIMRYISVIQRYTTTNRFCLPLISGEMILLSSLERIVKSDSRYNKAEQVDAGKEHSLRQQQKNERLKGKFDRLYAQKREAVLSDRLNSLPTSRALKFAIIGDELKLRQELLYGHPVNELDARSGRTVLHESAAGGHLPLVRMLVYEFHADLNAYSALGRCTALHMAVDKNYRQIAAMLLANGADIHKRDMFGRTPLHMVKSATMLKLLLKFKPDVAAKTNKGLTPLGYYLKNTPEDERVDEIWHTLGPKEDRKIMEDTRKEVARTRESLEAYNDKWALVADSDSTLAYDPDANARPW